MIDAPFIVACGFSLLMVVWLSADLMRTRAALRVAVLGLKEIEDHDRRVNAQAAVNAVLGEDVR